MNSVRTVSSRLDTLRQLVFRVPKQSPSAQHLYQPDINSTATANPDEIRTLHKVIEKPLQQERYKMHWAVDEIWDWPRVEGMKWRDLKKESITSKLMALKRRGKGPLCRAENAAAKAASGKKKRK